MAGSTDTISRRACASPKCDRSLVSASRCRMSAALRARTALAGRTSAYTRRFFRAERLSATPSIDFIGRAVRPAACSGRHDKNSPDSPCQKSAILSQKLTSFPLMAECVQPPDSLTIGKRTERIGDQGRNRILCENPGLVGPGPARNRRSPLGETGLDMGALHFALFPFFGGMAVKH